MSDFKTIDPKLFAEYFESINSNKNLDALKDLGSAIGEVLANEKAALCNDILIKDIKPTGEKIKETASKARSFGERFLSIAKYSKEMLSEGKAHELLNEAKASAAEVADTTKKKAVELYEEATVAYPKAKNHLVSYVDRISGEYSSLQTEDDKARYILKLSLYGSVLAYGFYKGNELPDSDFAIWGAGAHRSFLSHSVVPFFIVSSGLTLLKRILERTDAHLPPDSDAAGLNQTVKTVLSLFGVGVGSGMAFHLAVDGLIQTGGTIRIHDLDGNVLGSLIPGTRIDDMAYTTAMSLFTFEETKAKVEAG